VKKSPDPGSGSATLHVLLDTFCVRIETCCVSFLKFVSLSQAAAVKHFNINSGYFAILLFTVRFFALLVLTQKCKEGKQVQCTVERILPVCVSNSCSKKAKSRPVCCVRSADGAGVRVRGGEERSGGGGERHIRGGEVTHHGGALGRG
jgi:hypothetical protein